MAFHANAPPLEGRTLAAIFIAIFTKLFPSDEGKALLSGGGEEASRWNGETVPASECKRSAKNLAISGLPMSASDLAHAISIGMMTGDSVEQARVSEFSRYCHRMRALMDEKADAKGDAEKVGQQGQDMQDD